MAWWPKLTGLSHRLLLVEGIEGAKPRHILAKTSEVGTEGGATGLPLPAEDDMFHVEHLSTATHR